MPSLGVLTTTLRLDSAEFNRKAWGAGESLKGIGGRARELGNDLGKLGIGLGATGAALAVNVIRGSSDAARELKILSGVANATTAEFQRMAFGSRSVGLENDKLANILKDVNDRVGDFLTTGGGPMADFFETIAPQVGVTAEQFRKLSGPQALQLYVDSLEKANLSQGEMTFFMEAMASDSSRLIPLLQNQGAAMGQLGDRAEELGLVLSDIELTQLEQAGEAMRQVAAQTEALTNKIAAVLSPVVTALSNQFLTAADDAGVFGQDAESALDTVTNATGFVLDAIEGIKRSFQVAGRFVAVFGLSAADVMLSLARDIVNFPTAATNELISLLNALPGIDIDQFGMSDLVQEIDAEIRTVRGAIQEGWADIDSILMEPLPSSQFRVLVDEATEQAERAVREAARIRESMDIRALTGGPTAEDRAAGDEAAKAQQDLEAKLEQIRVGNLAELALLEEQQAAELALIDQGEAAKAEILGSWADLRRDTEARHQDELTDLAERAADERTRLEEQRLRERQATTGQILGNITALMGTESRKMFEIGKAAGIANSIVSTITGASKALELGWPLGPIAAAAITANGFAKVQAIRNQSFGGGGGTAAAGGGGAALPAGGGGVAQGGQATARGTAETSQVVYLNGILPGQLYDGRQILDALNMALSSGGELRIGNVNG